MIITMSVLLPCQQGDKRPCRMPTDKAVVYQSDDEDWKLAPACEHHLPALARTHPESAPHPLKSDEE